ncbi:MAG: adenylate/guanylate cyclase domain-containing protein [Candidatus Rifleibacteriota bacterium]
MSKFKLNNKQIFILAGLFFISSFLLLFCIILQQNQLIKLKEEAALNRFEKLIPVLQEQAKPVNTASAYIKKAITSTKSWNKASAKDFSHQLTRTFSQDIEILILDNQHQILTTNAISLEDTALLQPLMKDFYLNHFKSSPHFNQESTELLAKHFDNTVDREVLPNFVNTLTCRYKQRSGLALFAILVPQTSKKSIRKKFALLEPRERLHKQFIGSIFAFIPHENFDNTQFLNKAFKDAYETTANKIFFGNRKDLIEKINSNSGNTDALNFKNSSLNKLQGISKDKSGNYKCFAHIEIPRQNEDTDKYFLFFSFRQASPGQKIIYAAVLFLLANNFLLFKVLKNSWQNKISFDFKLTRKFVVLAFLACIIPILGLFYQNYLRLQLDQSSLKRKKFAELNEKISKVEINNRTEISELTTAIRRFNSLLKADEPVNPYKLQNAAYELREHSVLQVYVAAENEKIYNFNTKKDWNTQDAKTGTILVKALIRFIQQNLKFKLGRQSKKQKVKEGLLVETAADAMGVKTLYRLTIKHFQLVPFKLIHGAVWACVTMQRDENNNPSRLVMYIVNRRLFNEKQIETFQQDQPQKNPELYFMHRGFGMVEKICPAKLEKGVEFQSILQSINNTGGFLNLELKLDNSNLLVSARRLKNMDWSCLTLAPMPESYWYNNIIILSLTAVTGYLIVLIILLANSIRGFFLEPVLNLTCNANKIARGEYNIKIDYEQKDEIGALALNMQQMANDLKEKEFLQRFLSDIARDAISGNQSTRATRIEATVLFSDIRSFTTLSENYPPEEIAEMLNNYMTLMETVIDQHSGSIEKFIGDAIMAVFLPKIGEKHPALRAVEAGLEMIQALKEFNKAREKNNQFMVKNGIGIASGELLMGTMGNLKGRRDYTVTGSTVNKAEEMEKLTKLAKPLPLVFCQETAREVAHLNYKYKQVTIDKNYKAFQLI